MRSERFYIILYSVASIISFIWMVEESTPLSYLSQLAPHIILLWYWFKNNGQKYVLFSLAFIFYTLTDLASAIVNTYSSVTTTGLAIVSVLLLSVAFYRWRSGYTRRRMYLALITVAYGMGYFLLIQDDIPTKLFIPIAIYATFDAIIFIVIAGMQLKNNFGYIMSLAGAFLYLLADGLYAFHFFVEELMIGEPLMGLLHFATQGLFVACIRIEDETDEHSFPYRQYGSTSK